MAPYESPSYLTPLSDLADYSPKLLDVLQELEKDFEVPLEKIFDQFVWEYKKGLSELPTPETRDTFMPMIPTYVQHIPSGQETGTFLALDLGGTNLRVCQVNLLGDHKWTMKQQKYKVSDALKVGDATVLFDYIAMSVDQFLTKIGTEAQADEKLFLGFTFSFPVLQTALGAGTLINWTKGFKCPNAQGKDVVQLLQDALDRKHIHVKCSALVNDTCGALMARAYAEGRCLCGGIFGTGTNGAYVEKLDNITKMSKELVDDSKAHGIKYMVVNTEWGAFDNERKVLPFTTYDSRVDRISINPRKQAFEKMISGMYLGEVTRNVILHLVDKQVIFKGYSSQALNAHYGLDTAIMSALEAASVPNSEAASDPLRALRKVIIDDLKINPEYVSDADCLAVARVSEIVGTRGCRLSAVALAATVRQTGMDRPEKKDQKVAFGLDGSLVEFYPRFEERVRTALRELLGEEVEKRVEIGLAKDGSGVGAALCAQSAKALEEAGLSTD